MPHWTRPVISHAVNPGHSLLSAEAWFCLGGALGLSPRELQIVQGVFADQKEAAIAFAMGISPHTVNTYFQRVYRKMHVHSRPELIVRVVAEYFALNAANSAVVDRMAGDPASIHLAKAELRIEAKKAELLQDQPAGAGAIGRRTGAA